MTSAPSSTQRYCVILLSLSHFYFMFLSSLISSVNLIYSRHGHPQSITVPFTFISHANVSILSPPRQRYRCLLTLSYKLAIRSFSVSLSSYLLPSCLFLVFVTSYNPVVLSCRLSLLTYSFTFTGQAYETKSVSGDFSSYLLSPCSLIFLSIPSSIASSGVFFSLFITNIFFHFHKSNVSDQKFVHQCLP